ncbi:MAG TPA: hypothetical protein VGF72_10110 [Gaiellaceae bacterium]|jgi:hypothetical protein
MAVEDEQGTEQPLEVDEADVELRATPDVVDDDDVEAHVWRAQS